MCIINYIDTNFFDDRWNSFLRNGESGNSYLYILYRSIAKILGRLSFLMDEIIIRKQTR